MKVEIERYSHDPHYGMREDENGGYVSYYEVEKILHDYAGHSDAVEFVKWLRKNKFQYIESDNKYAKFGARHILFTIKELYQAFLNREEGK
jgi:hypothetical protein